MFTFNFLLSSCGCSSKGLPAISGFPVSESKIFKSQSPHDFGKSDNKASGGYLSADMSADASADAPGIINIGIAQLLKIH